MTAIAIAVREQTPTHSMFERVRCYLCDSARSSPFIEAEDDLTGKPGRFSFVRCARCGLVYQSPRLTLDHVKAYYDEGYIAHQKNDWGPLTPLFTAAMGSLDRRKIRLVSRYVKLGKHSSVLDVGCGAGTFLDKVSTTHGAATVGVDFMDLSDRPAIRKTEFHCGLFYHQRINGGRFDLVTMWHFLEHDYDPLRSLACARDALSRDGRLIIEVPRLDSLTFRLFRDRWPGLQAPQHTALYERSTLLEMTRRAGLEVVDYLPYGAFPPYFYLFCGLAFQLRQGRGLNLQKAIYAYFAGQLLALPVLPLLKHMNFAMQTVVCRRAGQ